MAAVDGNLFPLLEVEESTAQWPMITAQPQIEPNTCNYDSCIYIPDLSVVRQLWSDDPAFLPTTITYSLTFIFGVVGNVFVVVALLGGSHVGRAGTEGAGVTSSFLVSLAIADVIFLLVCVPYELTARMIEAWTGGRMLCKLYGYVDMLSAFASVLNLVAVSVERYVVIVHPIKSRSWCSIGRTHKIILGVWVASLILSSPMIYASNTTHTLYYNNVSYVETMICHDSHISHVERKLFAWYQLTAMFILPVLAMLFCYSFVIAVLWRSTVEHARLTNSSVDSVYNQQNSMIRRVVSLQQRDTTVSGDSMRCHSRHEPVPTTSIRHRQRHIRVTNSSHSVDVREARKQVIKMLLTIVTVFFCCWGPKWILNVLKRHDLKLMHSSAAFFAWLTATLLPYIQSCANPVIYGFMSQSFRRRLWLTWRHLVSSVPCLLCCRKCIADADNPQQMLDHQMKGLGQPLDASPLPQYNACGTAITSVKQHANISSAVNKKLNGCSITVLSECGEYSAAAVAHN